MVSGKTMGLRGRRAEDDDAGRSALETVLMVEFRLLRQCLFFVITMVVLEHGRWLIPELVFGECAAEDGHRLNRVTVALQHPMPVAPLDC